MELTRSSQAQNQKLFKMLDVRKQKKTQRKHSKKFWKVSPMNALILKMRSEKRQDLTQKCPIHHGNSQTGGGNNVDWSTVEDINFNFI